MGVQEKLTAVHKTKVIAMGAKHGDVIGQLLRKPLVIRIEKCDEGSPGRLNPSIPSR